MPFCVLLPFIQEGNGMIRIKIKPLRVQPITFPATNPSLSWFSAEDFHTLAHHSFLVLSCRVSNQNSCQYNWAQLWLQSLLPCQYSLILITEYSIFSMQRNYDLHDYKFSCAAQSILPCIASISHKYTCMICCSWTLYQCYGCVGFSFPLSHPALVQCRNLPFAS